VIFVDNRPATRCGGSGPRIARIFTNSRSGNLSEIKSV